MVITKEMLQEIAFGVRQERDRRHSKYAHQLWSQRGQKKLLRAAKNGKRKTVLYVRTKYSDAIMTLLASKGFNPWHKLPSVFFVAVICSW